MTRTLFLHIGPQKTGSTAIQTYFRDNSAAFRRQGLYRPLTGTEYQDHVHRPLALAFEANSGHSPLIEALAAELQRQGLPDRVFISAELFAKKLNRPEYVAAVKTFAGRLGYRLHIIAYIRPQAPLLNSLYTQFVKNWRKTGGMARFLALQVQLGEHDYVQQFALLFDDRDIGVSFRTFNHETLKQGLTNDIAAAMGLEIGCESLVAPAKENTSPGPKTIRAFQVLARRIKEELPNLSLERRGGLSLPIAKAADRLGWNAEKFGGIEKAEEAVLDGAFRASNAELAQRLWSKPWADVFNAEECRPPPLNTFDPSGANQADRLEFRGFINQSMATIAEFGSTHHGHGKRM